MSHVVMMTDGLIVANEVHRVKLSLKNKSILYVVLLYVTVKDIKCMEGACIIKAGIKVFLSA